MALADETDAREAVRLMLAAGTWSEAGATPGDIEVVEGSKQSVKRTRRGDAVYVWQPADTDVAKFGAAGGERTETTVIQVEVWTTTSAAQAHALAEDAQSIIGGFANDSQGSTKFVDAFPIAVSDVRHEATEWTGEAYVIAVQVRLRRVAAV